MGNIAGHNKSQFDIVVQKFSSEFTEAVGDLILKIQTEEFEIPITLAQQPDLSNIQDFYQIGKGNFWVALYNGQVIGTIALLDIGSNQVALRKMFVHKEYRGSKLGTAQMLLSTTFNWCHEQGLREIYLGTTTKFLAAHRFYEKNNFIEISKEDLPKKFPIMNVDTKFYVTRF